MGARKLRYWNSLTRGEQLRYLKEHPNSAFRRAPLKDAAAGENPDAEATSVPRMNPRTGLPYRNPTSEDRRAARDATRDLSNPGATDPNSEQREAGGASTEDSGADVLTKGFGKKLLENVLNQFGAPRSNRGPVPTDPTTGQPVPNPNALTMGEKAKVAGGMLACAALLGVGLLAIHPTLAIMVGEKVAKHFGAIYQGLTNSGTVEASAEAADPHLDEFVSFIADYVRKGELPEGFVAHARQAYGV